MFYVGIDIGKETHEASIIDEQGNPQGRSIRFSNTMTEFQRFLSWLPQSPVKLVMEATGHYWLPLYDFLKGKDFEITVLNPLQTEALRRGKIRKTRLISETHSSSLTFCGLKPSVRATSPMNGFTSSGKLPASALA
jgi:transposase